MKLKGDPGTARALNRRLVLNQIRRNGPMSRTAITAACGLSPAAITFVTADLNAEGLLAEGQSVPGTGGRRPVELDIDYDCRLSIGLKVMVDKVVGAATNLATTVIADCEVPLCDTRPQTVVDAATDAVKLLLAAADSDAAQLSGVGVALPGLIDAESGICRLLHRFGWQDVPIAALLAERLSAPVWVDNDANAFAVAQHLFGHGRNARNIAAVAIGRGVGAGLVIDGTLYRGTNGGAGEFGHDLSERGGRECECGRIGCLECYCSEPGIVRSWRERGGAGGAESLALAAAQDDRTAHTVLREAGLRLGLHVSSLVNLFDPEVIVIGGEAVRFGRHLFDPVRERLVELCFAGAPPLIVDWQDNAWARGASALAIQHLFNFEVIGGHEKKGLQVKELVRNRPA